MHTTVGGWVSDFYRAVRERERVREICCAAFPPKKLAVWAVPVQQKRMLLLAGGRGRGQGGRGVFFFFSITSAGCLEEEEEDIISSSRQNRRDIGKRGERERERQRNPDQTVSSPAVVKLLTQT